MVMVNRAWPSMKPGPITNEGDQVGRSLTLAFGAAVPIEDKYVEGRNILRSTEPRTLVSGHKDYSCSLKTFA